MLLEQRGICIWKIMWYYEDDDSWHKDTKKNIIICTRFLMKFDDKLQWSSQLWIQPLATSVDIWPFIIFNLWII